MKWSKKNLALLLAVSVLALSGCHRKYSMEKKAKRFVTKISRSLDLNEEQKEVLVGIKNEFLVKFNERKKIRKANLDLFVEEFQKETIDRGVLEQMFKKRQANQKEMHTFMAEKLIQFHSSLTTEQKNELAEKMQKRRYGRLGRKLFF